jgi:hypothetical protein
MQRSLLGALGATAALALASTSFATPQVADQPLDTSSSVLTLRGALSGIQPPRYDGPVKWKVSNSWAPTANLLGGAALGLLGGGFVALVITSKYDSRGFEKLVAGAMIGTVVGFGAAGLSNASSPRTVEFQTAVQEVVSGTAPHTEMVRVRSGKSTRMQEQGPYFGQVIAIPESDFVLAANSYQAPLIPGQKIKATFLIDVADNSILSWSGVAAPR